MDSIPTLGSFQLGGSSSSEHCTQHHAISRLMLSPTIECVCGKLKRFEVQVQSDICHGIDVFIQ